MTAPFDINTVIPKKWKPFVGLIGSLLTLVVPYIVDAEQWLPAPWPGVIGVVIAFATALGIYHAPYAPAGTVLVDKEDIASASSPEAYPKPWPSPDEL